MKRPSVMIVSIFALILTLTACSNPVWESQSQASENSGTTGPLLTKTSAMLTGKIIQLYNDSFLIAGSGSTDLYVVSSKLTIYDGNNKVVDVSALKKGQNVEVGYSGEILAIYLSLLSKLSYIRIAGQGDDLVGFYQGILDKLWDTDKGLNPDTGVLAFDLSKITNLTDAEKSALVYLVSNSHGLQGITGTFDELSKQGYIDKEKLYFKGGMLFQLKLTDVTESSFTFDAKKWCSGDGADMIFDCKAVKNEAGWSYTVGSRAIS